MKPELRALLDSIRAVLDEDAPSDPYQRAKTRMDDAAKRGGIDKAIKATFTRINAAESQEKLKGIVDYVADLITQLEKVKKEAQKKLGSEN